MSIRPLKIGSVPYVNVLPLLEGLEEHFPRQNWIIATPRELAGHLASGTVDVAMLSTFEGLRRGYQLVPGVMIGSNGPVRSVSLFSKVPPSEITSILLDAASLSSVQLARIIASDLLRISPEWRTSQRPLDPDDDPFGFDEDAVVVIGDTALAWEHLMPWRIDLGAAWRELTGLPFVFAAWWIRHGIELTQEEIQCFVTSRIQGEQRILHIVENLNPEILNSIGGIGSARQYLQHAVRFRLGDKEMAGLQEFRRRLIIAGHLPQDTPPINTPPAVVR